MRLASVLTPALESPVPQRPQLAPDARKLQHSGHLQRDFGRPVQRLRSGHSGFAEALSFPVQRLSVLSPPSPVVDLVVGDCFTCSGRAQVAVIWRAPYRALGPALNQPITVMTCVEVEIFFLFRRKWKKN